MMAREMPSLTVSLLSLHQRKEEIDREDRFLCVEDATHHI